MIRLTLRQFRTQGLIAAVALAAVAVVALLTRGNLVHLYDTMVAGCARHGDCANETAAFMRTDAALRSWLGILVIAVPGIVGIFWGAPLVSRELETGTFRLAWTQSVTRVRWLAMKLALLGAAVVAGAGLLSLVVTWWASPLDRVEDFPFSNFDMRGVVPMGYALFAFVLGVAVGMLVRRSLPAMAVTFVAFIGARLSFVRLVRPHLFTPLVRAFALAPNVNGIGQMNGGPPTLFTDTPTSPDAWVYSSNIVDGHGRPMPSSFLTRVCSSLLQNGPPGGGPPGGGGNGTHVPVPTGPQQALTQCADQAARFYHLQVIFQPASRYWPLQWTELSIFVGASVVLAAACVLWVRRARRLSGN